MEKQSQVVEGAVTLIKRRPKCSGRESSDVTDKAKAQPSGKGSPDIATLTKEKHSPLLEEALTL